MLQPGGRMIYSNIGTKFGATGLVDRIVFGSENRSNSVRGIDIVRLLGVLSRSCLKTLRLLFLINIEIRGLGCSPEGTNDLERNLMFVPSSGNKRWTSRSGKTSFELENDTFSLFLLISRPISRSGKTFLLAIPSRRLIGKQPDSLFFTLLYIRQTAVLQEAPQTRDSRKEFVLGGFCWSTRIFIFSNWASFVLAIFHLAL